MHAEELLEEIVEKEFRGLCTSCAHEEDCNYRLATIKLVIQCEMHEVDETEGSPVETLKGLCMNCANAAICKLHEKKVGVWHCNEYA